MNLEADQWYHFVGVVGPDGNTGYLHGQEMTGRQYNLGANATYTDFFASVPVREMLAIGYGRFGKQDPFYHFQGSIDGTRIAAYGGSAGGGASLWLGLHDDLADPNSADPVLRESTRLAATGHLNSQATYDFVQWPEIPDIDPNRAQAMNSREDLELYGIEDRSRLCDPDIVAMRAFLDMPAFMAANDPPLYTHNLRPDTDPRNAGEVIHHPRHAICLKQQCELFGIPCTAVLADTPLPERIRLVDFFVEQPTGFGESVNDISP